MTCFRLYESTPSAEWHLYLPTFEFYLVDREKLKGDGEVGGKDIAAAMLLLLVKCPLCRWVTGARTQLRAHDNVCSLCSSEMPPPNYDL